VSGGGRLVAAAAAAGVAGLGLVLGLAMVAGAGASASAAESLAELAPATCVVSGPVPGLTAGQAANADTVVSAALAAGGENMKAAQIAVMTAMTESGLENLAYGTADSLGLFQQRPSQSWGTPAQVMDPGVERVQHRPAELAEFHRPECGHDRAPDVALVALPR
jgi:hypothetical protein